MTDRKSDLERQLLSRPFDAELRSSYARALADDGDWTASLEQWRLVLSVSLDASGPHLEAAACCVRLGRDEEARTLLDRARACDDFDPDDPRLRDLPEDGTAGRLRVVAGGRDPGSRGEVVRMTSPTRVRFADIVGMDDTKKAVRMRIIEPFVKPGLFQRFKKRSGGGVLLYGPPGCGKTMMARAIATECKASFTAVGISDILSMWHGESERNLSEIFAKAREESPSVLFFDELDALAFSRSKASSDHTRTLVNEFLAQLDGMSGDNDRVLILAATNMPWDVDEAMKRPGRFDRQLFVPPPDAAARAEMFRLKLIDVPTEDIDWADLGRRSKHFSGADVDGALERAKEAVLDEILGTGRERPLRQEDLRTAIDDAVPSTMEWLRTARNLVKFGGGGRAYKDVEAYLRGNRLY